MSKQSEARRDVTSKDVVTFDEAISSYESLGGYLYKTKYILAELGRLDKHYRDTKSDLENLVHQRDDLNTQVEAAKSELAKVQNETVETQKQVTALTAEVTEKESALRAYSSAIDKITGKAA